MPFMSNKFILLFPCLFLFGNPLFSQTPLTGEISGTYKAGDYMISGTVLVMPSSTLRFLPGTRIYFDQFSDLQVEGTLICQGTKDRSILFESKSALTMRLPEAFDWNGISCGNQAELIDMA
jgi:hypothetical protein